jgi:hypothetical protein
VSPCNRSSAQSQNDDLGQRTSIPPSLSFEISLKLELLPSIWKHLILEGETQILEGYRIPSEDLKIFLTFHSTFLRLLVRCLYLLIPRGLSLLRTD